MVLMKTAPLGGKDLVDHKPALFSPVPIFGTPLPKYPFFKYLVDLLFPAIGQRMNSR